MNNSKPLILIEALVAGNDSGLGQIARLFLESLKVMLKSSNVILLLPEKESPSVPKTWECLHYKPRSTTFWRELIFPTILFKHRPSLVICLGQTIPKWRPKSHYHLLINDVGPLEDLPFPTSKYDTQNKRLLQKMIPRANTLWTISEFTKDRILTLAFPSPKTHPSIEVLPPTYKPQPDWSTRFENSIFPKEEPFILSLGNIEPRKNYTTLIKAFEQMCRELNSKIHLVILGHKAWGYPEVKAVLENCRFKNQIHCLGHVPDSQKWGWLKECQIYVSASLYEGWGFPLYEALFIGKPSVYNSHTAQSEFADGFAIESDTSDVNQLKSAMLKIIQSEKLRLELSANLKENFPRSSTDLSSRFQQILKPFID